jgi:hypothetical protein
MQLPSFALYSVRFVNTSESGDSDVPTEAGAWFELARWACSARHSLGDTPSHW